MYINFKWLKKNILSFFILFLFFINENTNAQCAGVDTEITVCDISNPANQSINLFNLLGPTATSGGVWIDPNFTGTLNLTTGVLNIWNVHTSGIFVFTYSLNGVVGCTDNNATVTVNVGGYSGVTSPDGSACSDDSEVNLFQFFNGLDPYPQFNGVWTSTDAGGALTDNIFNVSSSGLGTFHFTYTMAALGSCPAVSSNLTVTVYRAPEPGGDKTKVFCETDDFSLYTNFNLQDFLDGEDPNGQWSDSGTGEISNFFDSVINIQNIFNNFGVGDYKFTYKVFPSNPVCSIETSEITISIENKIDLTGATLVINQDICENQIGTATFQAVLTQGIFPIPNDIETYSIKYHLDGPGVSEYLTNPNVDFVNGICVFTIDPIYFQLVGTYTIHIDDIKINGKTNICDHFVDVSSAVNIFPLPKIDNAILSINPICKNQDALVQISNLTNIPGGNYQFTYNLTGTNQSSANIETVVVSGGTAILTIPATFLQNIGSTTVTIIQVTNLQTGCSLNANKFKNFLIVDLPNIDNIVLSMTNGCQNFSNLVTISGLGGLTNISITYDLSGVNLVVNQTVTLTAVSGNATFSIPSNLLSNVGVTTITVTSVTNLTTNCSINANIPKNFEIKALPNVTNFSVNVVSVCQNEPITVQLSGLDSLTNFKIIYQLSGVNSSTNQSINLIANSGLASFIIPTNLINNSGSTTISIETLTDLQSNCLAPINAVNTFVVNPIPNATNYVVSIPNVCENNPVLVSFSGLEAIAALTIEYEISGANTTLFQTENLTVSGGNAVLTIPSALVPNTGSSIFKLTKTSIALTGCSSTFSISKSFVINEFPDVSSFGAVVPDYCKNDAVIVALTGLGNLTNIQLIYSLSGANVATNQTIILAPIAGTVNFTIPSNFIVNTGFTTLIISKLINSNTSCEALISNLFDGFTIFDKLNSPILSPKTFCIEDNPTIANLTPFGTAFNWYDSPTSTTILNSNTPLISGNYYAEATNSATGCVSDKSIVAITIEALSPPMLNENGQKFCGADKPRISDLTLNASTINDIAWYDSATNGNLLPNTEFLVDGVSYFGFQISNATNCISQDNLKVTVSLTNCDQNQYGFFVPDGFSPNGDTVNDTFRIPDIEFLFPDYSIEIYNRYGNLMFKGNINKPNWDGRSAASNDMIDGFAPNGVYFYVLNFNKNNVPPKQGRLYLNR